MRQILEDALLTYRQEWENLLPVVSPAMVLGPIAAVVAASGLFAGLVTLPLFVLLCIVAYAACVRATVLILSNLTPDPRDAYLGVLTRAWDIVRAAIPSAVTLVAVTVVVVAIAGLDGPVLGVSACTAGAAVLLLWTARHAYDQPLILAHGLTADEALRAGAQLARRHRAWTLILVVTLSSPLLVAALASWGLAAIVTAPFGGAVFCLAIALWLPLLAIGLTDACAQLV